MANIDSSDSRDECAADEGDGIQCRKILDRSRFQIGRYFDPPSPDIGVTGPGCKPLFRFAFPVASTSLPV